MLFEWQSFGVIDYLVQTLSGNVKVNLLNTLVPYWLHISGLIAVNVSIQYEIKNVIYHLTS